VSQRDAISTLRTTNAKLEGELAMKSLAAMPMMLALVATSVNAQTTIFTPVPQNPAFGIDPIVRVTSTFRAAVTVAEPQAVPDARAQETARVALYRMAENECVTLAQIFKGECRVSSVSILDLIVPANAPPSAAMNATAVYEIKPRGQASGR